MHAHTLHMSGEPTFLFGAFSPGSNHVHRVPGGYQTASDFKRSGATGHFRSVEVLMEVYNVHLLNYSCHGDTRYASSQHATKNHFQTSLASTSPGTTLVLLHSFQMDDAAILSMM